MANTKEIRRRIKTVTNIRKITGAMKMVAAAKLKKVQSRAVNGRPYSERLREVVENLAGSVGNVTHPLMETRPEKRVLYIVVGADRGLAGSFNTNLMNHAMREIGDRDRNDIEIIAVGSKAISFFKKRAFPTVHVLDLPKSGADYRTVTTLSEHLSKRFTEGEVDAVYMIYAKFISAMTQEPTTMRLLPMAAPETSASLSGSDFTYEPSPDLLLQSLLPRYMNTLLYMALIESQASEQGARMSAMTAATNNADDVIGGLTLMYNKARQSAITTELTEIVSGAAALE
ncbi:MAG: ATP synthase F1 subunit gamma [Abditibacteriota bacterium]|nr:ATP synthase F1 subunit gamma [Abditibacteriota bacterium]MBP5094304.1 ATP synthase F1 subunit gamma [Abditibacteriota bacterium]MBP5717805.1 ATP synthase F1 subunit gamma [Abditibacteriota bacterium]MBP5738759.1 ATP synthase F1 subunit gamma [Abditibacteriota bacterium]